jgi:hypothetical protein
MVLRQVAFYRANRSAKLQSVVGMSTGLTPRLHSRQIIDADVEETFVISYSR